LIVIGGKSSFLKFGRVPKGFFSWRRKQICWRVDWFWNTLL